MKPFLLLPSTLLVANAEKYQHTGFIAPISRKCAVLFDERRDCGYVGINENECHSRGCCWNPPPNSYSSSSSIPWCFHPNADVPEYFLDANMLLRHRHGGNVPNCPSTIQLYIRYSDSIVNLKLLDQEFPRPTVPKVFYENTTMKDYDWKSDDSQSALKIQLKSEPFQFGISRKAEGSVIFDTEPFSDADLHNSIRYRQDYIEIGTGLPAGRRIYGLGEQVTSSFAKKPGKYALNARDSPAVEGENTYGSHPFYMQINTDGKAHGVLLLNSHPMEVEIANTSLVYRALGGIIDVYFFAGPTPDAVIEQYTSIIGRPPLWEPWIFGLHQCRFGYKTLAAWMEVVKEYNGHDLPLDGIWFDIE